MISKREFSAIDGQQVILYGKTDPDSVDAYPILVDPTGAIRAVSGFSLPTYNTILLTYSSGNLTTVIYLNGSVSCATITLSYSGSTLIGVQKT